MEAKSIINIAKSRKVIAAPGKYALKVTSVNTYTDETGLTKQIVNLDAWRITEASKALKMIKSGNITEEALKGALTINLLVGQKCPTKGDRIYVFVEEVRNKAGETVLATRGWAEMPVSQAITLDWDSTPETETEQSSDELLD